MQGMDEPTRYPVSETAGPPAPRHVSLARPHARTGGRTRPDQDLSLEALVTTSEQGRRYEGARTEEHRRICDFCANARTVAAIVAELRRPPGGVNVIVAGRAAAGLVLVHQPGLAFGDRSCREFMQRLLNGLRAL